LSLVPTSPGQLIVDIGCGEGRVGRDLRRRGDRVLGIDSSFTMVHAATTHPTATTAVAADAARLPLADASADCVIAFMSLQDMDNMPKAIEEAARILKDGQRFALAIVHPMYSVGKFSDDDLGAGNSFVISRPYFDKKRCTRTDVHDDLIMTFHREHRPLQAYTQALKEAGFSIEELHEVTEPDPAQPRHVVPMFLDIVAVRQPRPHQTTSRHQPGSNRSGTEDHLRQHRRLGIRASGGRSNPHSPGHPSPDRLPTAPAVHSADQQDRPEGYRFWPLFSVLSALSAAVVTVKAHLPSYHPH
jgi:ubiquinone/menaquinone biosynthesis C-methylase UbiE